MLKAFSVVGCFITYIAWVHVYTPGGSAIKLPLFIVHACQNRKGWNHTIDRYIFTFAVLGTLFRYSLLIWLWKYVKIRSIFRNFINYVIFKLSIGICSVEFSKQRMCTK